MSTHSFSAGISFALTIITIAAGQTFKTYLSASRQGTLIAGLLGSLVFLFTLTAISNLKMSSAGSHVKSGLGEVVIALLIGIIASASIHRVSGLSHVYNFKKNFFKLLSVFLRPQYYCISQL